jgi:hypothetical protein
VDNRREFTKPEPQWITETKRRLAQRRGKKPDTKSGQIRALWPEIQAAIAEGQSLKSIRQWLEEEGGVVVTRAEFGFLPHTHSAQGTAPPSSADCADFTRGAHRIQGGAQGPEKKAQILDREIVRRSAENEAGDRLSRRLGLRHRPDPS